MPVMDGHTAIRAIRAWEREQGLERIRIFALSAHALEEEIRESLASGCDDHLTKPIRKKSLLATLAAVARAVQGAEASGGVPHVIRDGPITVVVDEEVFDLIPKYLERRRDDVQAVAAALAEGDFEAIRRLGHGMKGSGGGYGLYAVTEMGGGLEEAGKERSEPDARQWLARLEAFLERVRVVSG